ncbi:hypothetical protein [Pectobacterium polaris]|uniref:hypothetical protein n=1 Tax=Pectobacterium polaris TaxID=2042057 RepID=UPI001CF229CD|nr:hypothetical protein [Pectobacterium polaris]MCA6954040.1 hypothetical protein [Pectobacterium polaris]
MRREQRIKRFDLNTRNQLRAILSDGEGNAIARLTKLSAKFGKSQIDTLDEIINSSTLTKAVKKSIPFPKTPQFHDILRADIHANLNEILTSLEVSAAKHRHRLKRLAQSLEYIDECYASKKTDECIAKIIETIEEDGWSHALLRKIVLIRENLEQNSVNEKIEELINKAGIKGVVVSTLIHTYTPDQSILMSKRSVLNIPNRGGLNRYTRTISKLSVHPFAISCDDLAGYLKEAIKCSLIDGIILAKFNSIFFKIESYPILSEISNAIGRDDLFEALIKTYQSSSNESENIFYKQSSAWLEYHQMQKYRALIDNYYDSSNENIDKLPENIRTELSSWVGETNPSILVSGQQFTSHSYSSLAKLEISGYLSRSAIFNYWLDVSEGQIGFNSHDLFILMGLTRDLARTIPVNAARTAAKLAKDELVKLIFLLLLAKRSKNELDHFMLRKQLESIAFKYHNGSLVELVKHYEKTHPYVAEYIYDIATEDFLAKLTKLAPHRADIPEIRASLHEWMAEFKGGDEYYLQRARAVRIDHQINRVRNEIDDHRIYVDPMRFISWIEDEMMLELNGALNSTGAGKKGVTVTCDETILSMVVTQSYNAFCSNPVFGIASYIGRRIRHGTFHGHMFSSVINGLEKSDKFKRLFSNPHFSLKWSYWKNAYNEAIEEIIAERLHVQSKIKPLGLLTPDIYNVSKQDVLSAAVHNISKNYAETISTADICPTIIDYCWRLAELDLIPVVHYLKSQQNPLKNEGFLSEELFPAAVMVDNKLADSFRRELELSIDRKLITMLGWFKRPSIVAPKASVSLLFEATVAEIKDTIPDFNPQDADHSNEEIDLVGNFYHLIYDSLAIIVSNAAKYADCSRPLNRKFEVIPGKVKNLVIEISSAIKPTDDPVEVSESIETRKSADFRNANMYDKKSGISKLLLLEDSRSDFKLDKYQVVNKEVQVRLIYALEH